jgi:lauroyl/myristoyl acyltransferase
MILAAAYRFGAHLVRQTPPGLRYALAAGAGAAFYEVNPFRRRAARANYAAVLGRPPADPEVGRVVRRASANYGRMLADFLLIGSLPPEAVRRMLSYDGREHVDGALARGRGAILGLPHMGTWDLCGSLAGILGYEILAVAEPMPGSLNREIVATRARHGLRIVMLGRAAVREINRALEDNHLVALLCDLPHGPSVPVTMFGRQAWVPPGPASLACRHRCPVIPVYSRRVAPGRYHVHVDPPVEPPEETSKEAARQMMQRVVDRFQVFIREHPDQWYAFRRVLT